MEQSVIYKELGIQDYKKIWSEMKNFVDHAWRQPQEVPEEIWFLEHFPVYTLGQAAKLEHIVNPGFIDVVQSDRGGQVTYHGPGQLIVYFLLNLRKRKLGVHHWVNYIEQLIIDTLKIWNIDSERWPRAPGIYVAGKKIASLGLRVRHGWCYHGLSLNVNMDLSPFLGINPCGMKELNMTQLAEFIPDIEVKEVKAHIKRLLGIDPSISFCNAK